MATTATTLTPEGKNFPLIGLTRYDYPSNYIPRSELLFTIQAGAVTVAGAGEDQRLIVNCNLPRGWAYVLLEASMRVGGVDVADWDDCATCELYDDNGSGLNKKFIAHMQFCTDGISHTSTTLPQKTYALAHAIGKVFKCDGSSFGRFQTIIMNTTVDGTVMAVDLYARFARFDLEQAHHYAVSTTVPVR